MRRTLTVLVTTAAFLLPAAAASATEVTEPTGSANASCSNGRGGNHDRTGAAYSGKGNVARAVVDCAVTTGDAGSGERRGGGDGPPDAAM